MVRPFASEKKHINLWDKNGYLRRPTRSKSKAKLAPMKKAVIRVAVILVAVGDRGQTSLASSNVSIMWGEWGRIGKLLPRVKQWPTSDGTERNGAQKSGVESRVSHCFTSGNNFSIRLNDPHIIVNVMKESESSHIWILVASDFLKKKSFEKKSRFANVELYAIKSTSIVRSQKRLSRRKQRRFEWVFRLRVL